MWYDAYADDADVFDECEYDDFQYDGDADDDDDEDGDGDNADDYDDYEHDVF